jgi:hypothetical protein
MLINFTGIGKCVCHCSALLPTVAKFKFLEASAYWLMRLYYGKLLNNSEIS